MSDVMEKPSESKHLLHVVRARERSRPSGFVVWLVQPSREFAREVHDTEGVLIASMCSAGVGCENGLVLVNPPEALNPWGDQETLLRDLAGRRGSSYDNIPIHGVPNVSESTSRGY